ncbi:MAG: hypothetical protein K6U89_02870 [Chloroflexi bacterium]|nr:hypothetical protein [Chloroflexota bacterium]
MLHADPEWRPVGHQLMQGETVLADDHRALTPGAGENGERLRCFPADPDHVPVAVPLDRLGASVILQHCRAQARQPDQP